MCIFVLKINSNLVTVCLVFKVLKVNQENFVTFTFCRLFKSGSTDNFLSPIFFLSVLSLEHIALRVSVRFQNKECYFMFS